MVSKLNLICIVVTIVCMFEITDVYGGATAEQMLAAGTLMRDACLRKFPKVTTQMADDVKNDGSFSGEKDVKCYVNCVLEMMNTMKKGKFLLEASNKQVDMLVPDELKADYKTGLFKCKDVGAGIKDNCEKSYLIFNCLRQEIKLIIFP